MRQSISYTLLNAKAATGVGSTGINVTDFKTIALSFATTASSTLTVKFAGSIQDTCPDFTAAQSATNHWDYIDVIDLNTGTSIDGDTGVAVAATTDYRIFEANVNGLRWVTAIVTAYTGGGVTVKSVLFTD